MSSNLKNLILFAITVTGVVVVIFLLYLDGDGYNQLKSGTYSDFLVECTPAGKREIHTSPSNSKIIDVYSCIATSPDGKIKYPLNLLPVASLSVYNACESCVVAVDGGVLQADIVVYQNKNDEVLLDPYHCAVVE